MEVKHEDENIPYDFKCTLENRHRILQDIPQGLPPSRDHEHQIELIARSTYPNKRPYGCPHKKKDTFRIWYNTCWIHVLFNQVGVPFQHE